MGAKQRPVDAGVWYSNKNLMMMIKIVAQFCEEANTFELHILNKKIAWEIKFILIIKLLFIKKRCEMKCLSIETSSQYILYPGQAKRK